jgi:hypothetical protein
MKLHKDMRVLNLTHLDMDGCACQVVLGNYFAHVDFRMCSYGNIDSALQTTPYDKYDVVFVTDIYPTNEDVIVQPSKTIILDHHDSARHLHSPKKMRFVVPEHCGAFLTKRFIETTCHVNLGYLDNLVHVVNDYDLWILHNPKSKFLNELYGRYREVRWRRRFFQGCTRLTPEETQYLRQRMRDYKATWESLEVYDLPKAKACLITASEFINDIADDLIAKEGYKLIFMYNPKSDHMSVRHKIAGMHMGNMLRELALGGGHEYAGGLTDSAHDTLSDKRDRVTILERTICERFPEARR